jgi:Glycosyl transferases group 1
VKLLYLYDIEGWAVNNVGKLWLDEIPNLQVTFMQFKHFTRADFARFDFVWFGYLDLFIQHYCEARLGPTDLSKSVVSVHDPRELFPQNADWKQCTQVAPLRWWSVSSWYWATRLSILQTSHHVITASNELHTVLGSNGVPAFLIPTTSLLSPRNVAELRTEKCEALSICNDLPRKNLSMMRRIQTYCDDTGLAPFDIKLGSILLPLEEYTSLIDDHEIYICTSYQEGGPIPAMDALRRGCVVLSTPVGQIQDLIADGENGFICRTTDDFVEALRVLASDLPLLHKMRINALETLERDRSVAGIKLRAAWTLRQIVAENEELGYDDLGNTTSIPAVTWLWQKNVHRILGSRVAIEVKDAVKGLLRRSGD